MSEENKTVELNDEELEKVAGGYPGGPDMSQKDQPKQPTTQPIVGTGYFCPVCKNLILMSKNGYVTIKNDQELFCVTCKMWVIPDEVQA